MQTATPRHEAAGPRRTPDRSGTDDLHYNLRISVWVRWFLLTAWLLQFNYRPNLADPAYAPTMLLAISVLVVNAYVHYCIRSNRTVSWRWPLALSLMDSVMITAGIAISSSVFHNTFFVLYYPALAMFAAVFTSFRLSFVWTTMVAGAYTALSLFMEPGVDFDIKEEKVLFTRIVVMYAVVAAVNMVSRFERIKRREALDRERELQRERIELSQTIHDTIAQSAYMIGLGIETAIELANTRDAESRDELTAKLKAVHALSKSTMWELRLPIDGGPIFEGRNLGKVLTSHISTFTTITSIPTAVQLSGSEPPLSTVTRGLLFSIAHNALTNAFRHSCANSVNVELSFQEDRIQLSVSDDGVGLPNNYEERGHGFTNMLRDAERMGGSLEAGPGPSGQGTTVTCVVPYHADQGDAKHAAG